MQVILDSCADDVFDFWVTATYEQGNMDEASWLVDSLY